MSEYDSEILKLYAEAKEESLKNAERWIVDAKLLIENSSFGHASALLRFAYEEIAKAFVCFYVSERLWPVENNKVVEDVFWNHVVKNQIIVGMFMGISLTGTLMKRELTISDMPEPTDQEIIDAFYLVRQISTEMEKLRQKGIYVDFKNEKILTPNSTTEKEVQGILREVEALLRYTKHSIDRASESHKERLREFFSSIPKEAWKTGEIPIEWLREKEE